MLILYLYCVFFNPDTAYEMRIRYCRSDVCSSDLRDRDDVVVAPLLDVNCVEPDIGPLALDRAAEEGLHPLVDLAAQPRHLALADAVQAHGAHQIVDRARSEEHTSELQSLMRISYAVFCLKKKKNKQ